MHEGDSAHTVARIATKTVFSHMVGRQEPSARTFSIGSGGGPGEGLEAPRNLRAFAPSLAGKQRGAFARRHLPRPATAVECPYGNFPGK